MKLKETFITRETNGEQIMTSVSGFSGLVRSNQTAAFIIDCLKNETTVDAIVEKMFDRYDAPKDVIANDVERVLGTLRSIGALDE